jgi:hypothetical protein
MRNTHPESISAALPPNSDIARPRLAIRICTMIESAAEGVPLAIEVPVWIEDGSVSLLGIVGSGRAIPPR